MEKNIHTAEREELEEALRQKRFKLKFGSSLTVEEINALHAEIEDLQQQMDSLLGIHAQAMS